MKSLLRSLLIALIPACPLIFSSCETSKPDTQATNDKPVVSNTHTDSEKPDVSGENLVSDSFSVEGLTCGDCNNILKTFLEDHPGIVSADVDYKLEPPKINTIVKHQAHVSKEDIIKIIKDIGYGLAN